MNINVTVKNKAAAAPSDAVIVCGNADYTLTFNFDGEWEAETTKIARFVWFSKNKTYSEEIPFNGNTVEVPILSNTNAVYAGVYAGNLRTTTPAKIVCEPSILCYGHDANMNPSDLALIKGQIAKLVDALRDISVDPAEIRNAVMEYLTKNPPKVTETDPTVPAWAKQPQKPEYTAKEVGAVASSELSNAVNDALAQAKASGEFDGRDGDPGKPGKDGQDYVLTPDDIAEIAEIVAKLVEIPEQDSGGNVDEEQIAAAVNKWLDEHPEATTTVKWGNIFAGEIFELATDEEPSVPVLVPCTGIALDKTELAFSDTETTAVLQATVTPFDTTDQIEWSVDNVGVATVENGAVKALANGSCVITAKCGAYSATCSVTVSIVTSATKTNLDGYFDFVDVEDNYYGTVENKAENGTLTGEIYKQVHDEAASEPGSVENGVLFVGGTSYFGGAGKNTKLVVYIPVTDRFYEEYPYSVEIYCKIGRAGTTLFNTRYYKGNGSGGSGVGTEVIITDGSTIKTTGAVGDGNNTIALDSEVDLTAYHHYVVVVDSALVRIYIDGVMVGEGTAANNTIIGRASHLVMGGPAHLKMCRVYNAILTDEQVANNYANTIDMYGGDV